MGKYIKHPPKEESLRINLRIRDRGTAAFLSSLGKTERTTFIEYALVNFMRTNQDDPLLQIYKRGENGHTYSNQPEPAMAKQPSHVSNPTVKEAMESSPEPEDEFGGLAG